jgi:hypothetical protein
MDFVRIMDNNNGKFSAQKDKNMPLNTLISQSNSSITLRKNIPLNFVIGPFIAIWSLNGP